MDGASTANIIGTGGTQIKSAHRSIGLIGYCDQDRKRPGNTHVLTPETKSVENESMGSNGGRHSPTCLTLAPGMQFHSNEAAVALNCSSS